MDPVTAPARRAVTSRAELTAHPVVRSWRRLRPGAPDPVQVDVLKEGKPGKPRKSLVYRLVGAGAGGAAVIAKRCAPAASAVERCVHEDLLPRLGVPTLRCYGAVDEADGCWIFVEDAGGERYSPDVAEHRALAAAWLARMHVAAAEVVAGAPLPEAGAARYLAHLRAARAGIRANATNPALRADQRAELDALLALLDRVETRWDRVEACAAGLVGTLVHGDFAGKNVRVRAGPQGRTVLPFDWEHAGLGAPIADLAQRASPAPRFLASPDLGVYERIVRRRWPALDGRAIRRLGHCGTICRCVAAADWETHYLAHRAVDWAVVNMRLYAAELSAAMRAEGLG